MRNIAHPHTGRHFLQIPGPTNVPELTILVPSYSVMWPGGATFTAGSGGIGGKSLSPARANVTVCGSLEVRLTHVSMVLTRIVMLPSSDNLLGSDVLM